MRGEYNRELEGKPPLKGSPPLARGIPPAYRMLTAHLGITPACAGNTFSSLNSLVKLRDHPRLRGEYCHRFQQCTCQQGSPPLARGIQLDPINLCKHIRITPACAGNTREATGATATIRDHPRLRGEYIVFFSQPEAEHGSPPLARGIRKRRCQKTDQ